jgi:hypothetical protein
MDHQAIVWCHGVLHQVRKVIWALSLSEDKDVEERLRGVQNVLGTDTYHEDLRTLKVAFKVSSFQKEIPAGST